MAVCCGLLCVRLWMAWRTTWLPLMWLVQHYITGAARGGGAPGFLSTVVQRDIHSAYTGHFVTEERTPGLHNMDIADAPNDVTHCLLCPRGQHETHRSRAAAHEAAGNPFSCTHRHDYFPCSCKS